MGISGVGSTFSYIYNSKTGKLSTKDGSADEFVDYFNGDLSGKDSKTLNGFDASNKGCIERMIDLFEAGLIGKNILNGLDGDEYEISGEIVDAATAEYAINGEKIFTEYAAVSYMPDEIKTFATIDQPFKTRQHKAYDPADNSINIAVGDVFDLGNGYKLIVKNDHVYGEGWGRDESKDKKMNILIGALGSLIHFADQQWFSGMIDLQDGGTSMVLKLLKELGVDTSREFIINGTKCEVKHGKIHEVGNRTGVPNSIYEKALERSEELAYVPLWQRMA